MDKLFAIVPKDSIIDWPLIERTVMSPFLEDMRNTPQTQRWHGEGDVWAHTRMVCEALVRLPEYQSLPERQQAEVFLAALLHDVGKPAVTKWEDGHYTTRGHARKGAQIARTLLWKDYDMAGTPDKQNFRETVCSLVSHHALPLHIVESPGEEPHFRSIAAEGMLASDYSWRLQCLLTEADVRGRIADDVPELLVRLDYCRLRAQELGCYEAPYPIPDAYTRFRYFDGHPVSPDYSLFNENWGEVIVMCGLPGTGKDTYIGKHFPNLPVVSLDGIRSDLDIGPSDNQGEVVQEALERAKRHLRLKESFVWNATNITRQYRRRICSLCETYGASVRIVYLETPWAENLRRNAARAAVVPLSAMEHMLDRMETPHLTEAENVEWICV